nr:tubulin-specific chaperone C-like [Penaeus vannamei]
MEKTIMMDMSDVDKDHHQTTDTTTISVISVTDEKEKVNDSSNKEKLTTTNVDIADSGNDDDVEHHQTATTNSTTITTTIDERKNVLDINNEEKTVLSKLRCNSGSDDDYHQIISTDEKEKVNDTTEEELTTTTRINVNEGLLTQKNLNVKNRETMIACTGFTDEILMISRKKIDIDNSNSSTRRDGKNNSNNSSRHTNSSNIGSINNNIDSSINLSQYVIGKSSSSTCSTTELSVATLTRDNENVSTLTMHDTNRNTLNPANIAERNMRGNKEDKSRPPLPKPDEENVDSSKTEERKRKYSVNILMSPVFTMLMLEISSSLSESLEDVDMLASRSSSFFLTT